MVSSLLAKAIPSARKILPATHFGLTNSYSKLKPFFFFLKVSLLIPLSIIPTKNTSIDLGTCRKCYSRFWPFFKKIVCLFLLFCRGRGEAGHVEAPGPWVEPTPQQRPKPLQWQCWIFNLLCHKRTPRSWPS